jgi:hypothetical protein
MGWEDRDGRRYYYRKKRVGGRVVSEYVGAGLLAELSAQSAEQDQRRAKIERRKWRKTVEAEVAIDRLMSDAGRLVKALTDATLAINGYHRHKGQWRKRKGTKT